MKIALRGTRLFVDVEGAAWRWKDDRLQHAPPLFILHGGPGGNHLEFKRSLGFLGRWFQLFYVDQRGGGFSDPCPRRTLTLAHNVADLESLRKALGFERISIVGVSYGGMVAASYAARHPRRIELLFLLGTAGSGDFLRAARQYLSEHGTAAQQRTAQRLWRGGFRTQAQVRHFFQVLGPLYSRTFSLAAFRQKKPKVPPNLDALNKGFRGFLRRYNVLPALRRVNAPAFVAAGRHDWICPVSQAQALAAHLPNATLRIYPNSAHQPQVDEPERFRKDVAAFVSRFRPRPQEIE
jgi:proline iminopeptidase